MNRKGRQILSLCIVGLLTVLEPHADVGIDAPRASLSGFKVGESIAETKRPYVHFLRAGTAELYTLNTDTGEFVAATKLAGIPSLGSSMSFSLDETMLYVPLTSAQKIQIISLASLGSVDIINVGVAAKSIAVGFDGKLYVTAGEDIYQVDAKLGGARRVGGDFLFLYNPLIKSDPSGTRLFVMEMGLSGGGEMLEEFAIVGGEVGIERLRRIWMEKPTTRILRSTFKITQSTQQQAASMGSTIGT